MRHQINRCQCPKRSIHLASFESRSKAKTRTRENTESTNSIPKVLQTRWSKEKRPADRANWDSPDLTYRRTVHQQRKSREQFLNSIPHWVQVRPLLSVWALIDLQSQEYGTKYWTAVCDLGTMMESFANYLWYTYELWKWKLWQLIPMPGIYRVLVIHLDQHSGHRPRISSLLLMQTATRRPSSLDITNRQSGFHQFTIKILGLHHHFQAAR